LADFDNNNFNIPSNRAENPWDSNFGARSGVDAPPRPAPTVSPLVKILAIILLVGILLYFLYTILIHPIDKLNLKLMNAKHCVISVTVSNNWGGGDYRKILIVYLDQEIFAIGDGYPKTKNLKYYKVIDDELYQYSEAANEWYESFNNNGDSDIFTADMFERKNYKWAKGRLFVWQYKDTEIFFKHRFGKFKFTYNYDAYNDVIIEFKKISTKHLPTPWDE